MSVVDMNVIKTSEMKKRIIAKKQETDAGGELEK